VKIDTTLTVVLVLCVAAAGVWAGEFKPYPGSAVDKEATEKSMKMIAESGVKIVNTVYTTKDSFEAVAEFYKDLAKEFEMPGMGKTRKLPSGQDLHQAFFIFDGAEDLASSKLWILVQNPYIGDMKSNDIRNVTAIVVSKSQ
jgi:hypothetical protein